MNKIKVCIPVFNCPRSPIVEVGPSLPTEDKQKLYEFKARVKVSDAVGIIEIAKHMKTRNTTTISISLPTRRSY